MKATLTLAAVIAALVVSASAKAPTPVTDLHKALNTAAKDQKMAFLLLGRSSCGNCAETKRMIKEGKIPVTSADYVVADLDCDNEKVQTEFLSKYSKESFGETLPFVVVTDSQGNALASSGGLKDAGAWTKLLTKAKAKATSKTGAAAVKGKGLTKTSTR